MRKDSVGPEMISHKEEGQERENGGKKPSGQNLENGINQTFSDELLKEYCLLSEIRRVGK